MALDWLLEDAPAYISRGQRIMSVLDGSGTVEVLPGRPDVVVDPSDFDKGEKFNPEIEFDPNSFSRMDKFDGLEVGQELIDSQLDKSKSTSKSSDSEEK
jgi:hypothetical protein